MAHTLIARLEATILDELDVEAKAITYVLLDPTASFNDVTSVLNTWLAYLDACTDGQIIRSTVDVTPALPGGLKPTPAAGSRVEQTGVLNFNADGDMHLAAVIIPAISNDPTVISGGKIVITGGSPVHTLFTLLAGGGTAALQWTNATSQQLASFASALISFRSSNRALARLSFETVE